MITMKICMSYKINKVDPVIGPNVWRRLSPIRVIAREQPFSDHQPLTARQSAQHGSYRYNL